MLLSLGACGSVAGPTTTEQRGVDGFHAIDLRGVATMDILVGPAASMSLTGDANSLATLKTRVQEGTLILETQRGWFAKGNSHLQIRLTTPALDAVALNGAGDITVNGLQGGPLVLVVQGAGNLEASGAVDVLTARTNGAGNLDLSHLDAREATVAVNGAGNIEVNASQKLDATVNGVGSITYAGKPKDLVSAIHGVGSISPK
jgi:hypothetical protein